MFDGAFWVLAFGRLAHDFRDSGGHSARGALLGREQLQIFGHAFTLVALQAVLHPAKLR